MTPNIEVNYERPNGTFESAPYHDYEEALRRARLFKSLFPDRLCLLWSGLQDISQMRVEFIGEEGVQ